MDKIRLAYFTSLRESIGDEGVSTVVVDNETGANYGYRVGSLEDLANRLNGDNPLADNFELAMVFCDDTAVQFETARAMTEKWPFSMAVPLNGSRPFQHIPLEQLTVRIPSHTWREIRDKREKSIAKQQYELEILKHLKANEVDLIISDSYLSIFGSVLLDAYRDRILNIHPAITEQTSQYRLPGVTPTRDAYTRANYGFIIVDDKKRKETWPEGELSEVTYNGEKRLAVLVPKHNVTGVTVHVVDELVDHGPVVKCIEHSFMPGTSYEGIRHGNYQLKRSILPEALVDYANRPNVRQLINTSAQTTI